MANTIKAHHQGLGKSLALLMIKTVSSEAFRARGQVVRTRRRQECLRGTPSKIPSSSVKPKTHEFGLTRDSEIALVLGRMSCCLA